MELPEEEEYRRKQVELADLEIELGTRELELVTLEAMVANFRNLYLSTIGKKFAELDALEALIAEKVAAHSPADEQARYRAEQARSKAQSSAEEADTGDAGAGARAPFKPSASLKELYRRAAKRMHPDLTTDAAEKTRRTDFMSRMNAAYARGDEDELRRILEAWESRPEGIPGEGVLVQLGRLIRQIAAVRGRLGAIESALQELRSSEWHRLLVRVQQASCRGEDLLKKLSHELDEDLRRTRERIARL